MLQDPLSLGGRLLLAALFLPAGIARLTGFAGAAGYLSSAGLPLPPLAAAGAGAWSVDARRAGL